MSFITNVRDYYVEQGFEVYPYTPDQVEKATKRLGGFPEIFKEYLLTVGRVEEEVQMPKGFLELKDMKVKKGMLILSGYNESCGCGTIFAIDQSDFDLNEDAPIYYYDEDASDWVEWSVEDDGETMKGLKDFFIVCLQDNIEYGIEGYRASRRFWEKMGYGQQEKEDKQDMLEL